MAYVPLAKGDIVEISRKKFWFKYGVISNVKFPKDKPILYTVTYPTGNGLRLTADFNHNELSLRKLEEVKL